MSRATVVECWRIPARAGPPEPREYLHVVDGSVVGDHHEGVTLLEAEAIESDDLADGRHRRNVVIAGVGRFPNPPVVVRFPAGPWLLAYERCEPCQHLAKLICRDKPPGELVHTGLRCRVLLTPGVIRLGDTIEWRSA